MTFIQIQFPKTIGILIIMIVFIGALMLAGCDDENPTSSEEKELKGVEVVIEPQNVTFKVGEEHDFSAFLISASGDTVTDEFDIEWNWYSSDPEVFTVQSNGTATGYHSGEAFCIVEASTSNNKITAKMVPIGLDSARVFLF